MAIGRYLPDNVYVKERGGAIQHYTWMNLSTSSYFLFYLLYSDSHNGRDRELHDLHVVGLLQGGDGSLGI